VLAARTLNIPVVLLECNVIPGAANRILNRFCTTTCMGWPMLPHHRQQWRCSVKHTGVPIRSACDSGQQTSDATTTHSTVAVNGAMKTLLVLGGSQGATGVDDLVTAACEHLQPTLHHWQVIHQTSAAHVATLSDFYRKRKIHATVQDFIGDVPACLSAAELVISRSGAVTLAEIADRSCASILIPLASAADNHQAANAALFVKAHAAFSIDSRSPDAVQDLIQSLEILCSSKHLRQQLAINARRLATPTAAAAVAEECLSAISVAAAVRR
jgi:UDP-N-acetylglucosamine--N-acetylmuramyl-(pentapeptide) pyrophosphoryl-undecaprenol N-acetylglucosamine transferase